MQVILFSVICTGLDIFRIWFGPLPFEICLIATWTKAFLFMTFPIFIAILTLMKFIVLCVIKRLPDIDDDFVAKSIIAIVSIIGMVGGGFKYLVKRKPTMNEVLK